MFELIHRFNAKRRERRHNLLWIDLQQRLVALEQLMLSSEDLTEERNRHVVAWLDGLCDDWAARHWIDRDSLKRSQPEG